MLPEWYSFVRLSQSCGVFRAIDFLRAITSAAFLRLFVIFEDLIERPMQLYKAERLHDGNSEMHNCRMILAPCPSVQLCYPPKEHINPTMVDQEKASMTYLDLWYLSTQQSLLWGTETIILPRSNAVLAMPLITQSSLTATAAAHIPNQEQLSVSPSNKLMVAVHVSGAKKKSLSRRQE